MEGAAEVVVSTVGVVVSTAAVAVFLAADITVEVGTAAIAAEGTAEGTAAATMAATKVVTPVVATGPTVAGAMEPMAGVARSLWRPRWVRQHGPRLRLWLGIWAGFRWQPHLGLRRRQQCSPVKCLPRLAFIRQIGR